MTNPTYTDEQVLKCAKAYEDYGEPVCPAMLRSLLADRQRLQAEVEALRQDASRYRWIRNDDIGAAERAILISDYGIPEVRTGASLDESIDTAIDRATPNETKEAKS